jgi:hypothetical protein
MSVFKQTDYLPGFILTGFVALLVVMGFFPGQVSAQPKTYGPWFQGSKNSAENWQANVTPWNADKSETINSGCIIDDKPLSDDEKLMLVKVLEAAGAVYTGIFGEANSKLSNAFIPIEKREDLKEAEKNNGVKAEGYFENNGGYPKGAEGYRLFLKKERELLSQAKWVPYQARKVVGDGQKKIGENDYQVPVSGTYVANTIGKDGQVKTGGGGINVSGLLKGGGIAAIATAVLIAPATPFIAAGGLAVIGGSALAAGLLWGGDGKVNIEKSQERLAGLLPQSNNPLSTALKLPFGCSLPVPETNRPDLKDFFSDTAGAVVTTLVVVIDTVVDLPYSLVKDRAWQWSFMTPHTERGDLIWQLPESCVAEESDRGKAATISNACKGGKNLGFSTEALSLKKQKAPFLSMSHFAQWLISGFYFIIFFTAIVFFIMKGTKSRVLNVLTIIPRVLLSIVLTVFATFIIGAIISFANFLVMSIFSLGSTWDVGAANILLAQPDLVLGGIADPLGVILRLIIKVLITYFYLLFVITAIVRQIALVILIVLAPIAIFCIINPAWQQYFNKWFRTLLAVAFIPVILAFLLKLGLIINPAINNPDATYGSMTLGLFSLVMLLAVFWAMARVLRASRNFILGQSSLATGAMAGTGDKLSRWGNSHGGALGRVAGRAGRNLSTASDNAGALGAMVPPDKVLGGAVGGLAAAGGGGAMGAVRAGLGGQIAPTSSKLPGKIQNWQQQRMADFDRSNTVIETNDRRAFFDTQKDHKNAFARSFNDLSSAPEGRAAQFLTQRRDAMATALINSPLGGMPIERHGRLMVEKSPERIAEALSEQMNNTLEDMNKSNQFGKHARELAGPSGFRLS